MIKYKFIKKSIFILHVDKIKFILATNLRIGLGVTQYHIKLLLATLAFLKSTDLGLAYVISHSAPRYVPGKSAEGRTSIWVPVTHLRD